MPFFSSTPNSQVELVILDALSPSTREDDIVRHLEICDMVNESQEGHKQAFKALKSKLTPKSDAVVQLKVLTIADTLVKNCGKRFHMLVTSKDFVNAMVKVMKAKNGSAFVREKVLLLIETWALAFRSDPNLRYVCEVYEDLKFQGVDFPAQNLDEMAPIHTPDASVAPVQQPARTESDDSGDGVLHMRVGGRTVVQGNSPTPSGLNRTANDEEIARLMSAQMNGGLPPEAMEPPPHRQQQQQQQEPQQQQQQYDEAGLQQHGQDRFPVSEPQADKVRSELEVVKNNCTMLNEMLGALEPTDELEGSDVISDLRVACEEMQARLVALIQRVQNEDLLGECLVVNDELTFVLTRYREMKEQRQEQSQCQGQEVRPESHFSADPFGVPTLAPAQPLHRALDGVTLDATATDPDTGSPLLELDGNNTNNTNNTNNANSNAVSSSNDNDDAEFTNLRGSPMAHGLSHTGGQNTRALANNTSSVSNTTTANGNTSATALFDPFGSSSNGESDQGLTAGDMKDAADFDPFNQHKASMQESLKRQTDYVVPESETTMKTFSSMFGADEPENDEPSQMMGGNFFTTSTDSSTLEPLPRTNRAPQKQGVLVRLTSRPSFLTPFLAYFLLLFLRHPPSLHLLLSVFLSITPLWLPFPLALFCLDSWIRMMGICSGSEAKKEKSKL